MFASRALRSARPTAVRGLASIHPATATHNTPPPPPAAMPVADANLSQLLTEQRKHVTPALSRLHDHIIVKGQGSKVWDETGAEFIDFNAGIGVTNLGQ